MSDEQKPDPDKFKDDARSWASKFKDDLRDSIHRDIHDRIHRNINDNFGRRRRPMVIGIDLRGGRGGMLTGAILVLIGLAFLLEHMGIISIGDPRRFWPLLVVLVGALNLMSRRYAWGTFLVLVGVLLQLNQLGVTHFGWAAFWPLLLIALGLFILWGSFEWRNKAIAFKSKTGDPRTTLNEAVVFGGLERRMTSQDFQGGDVTAIFGGVELDLTEANMQASEATLAITAIFGGVEIRVPPSWQVVFRGSPIFGGIEDKTRTARVEDSASSNLKMLVITGAVIFGGLEIKN